MRYSIKVSYIEIYKEELQDLLDLDTSSKDLHVREDDKGNTGDYFITTLGFRKA